MKKFDRLSTPCFYEGSRSIIYLQQSAEYRAPVIIKMPRHMDNLPAITQRFANEYRLIKDLSIAGTRKAYQNTTLDGRPALVLEYFEGHTLEELFVRSRKCLKESLAAALAVAKALDALHHHRIIHRNISSTNILYNPAISAASIIDFAAASDFCSAHRTPDLFDLSLPYISPEQTGRMNQAVDYRTDLYSLGVVLYQMLTGQLPFEGTRASEIVHCHIAKNPHPPAAVNPDIPGTVSDMIMKLMAKNPRDRYQSAHGLISDIGKCLDQIEQKGEITAIELACDDYPGLLQIPRKLYGREKELKALMSAFERAQQGAGEFIVLSGAAGSGKSMLFDELLRKGGKGYFLKGKHDESQQKAPYTAIIQALSELITQILATSTPELAWWKENLTEALGEWGSLMIEMMPPLELVIGNQPAMKEMKATERQAYIHQACIRFISAVTKHREPLVLFIDNLQWADEPTLLMLKSLVSSAENRYLLLIGAYRDNDMRPAHPLLKVLEELNGRVATMHLGNLPLPVVQSLIAESLKCDPSYVHSLAELIEGKTGGNYHCVIQFLHSLSDEGLLIFDPERRKWIWDSARIQKMNVTDNIAAMITERIGKLPRRTQKILALAACIGNTFSLAILSELAACPSDEALEAVMNAIEKGMLQPRRPAADQESHHADQQFEFTHGRIREASYTLLDRKERKKIHHAIGHLLLNSIPVGKMEERIGEIIDHFNEGFQHVKDEQERLRLVDLNLIAGKKAKISGAFQTAAGYLSMAAGLLPPDKWDSHYTRTLEIYMEAMESEYLGGTRSRGDLLSSEALLHTKDDATKIRIHEMRIFHYRTRCCNEEAISDGLTALKILGEPIPADPEGIDACTAAMEKEITARLSILDTPESLPPLQDEHVVMALRLLAAMISPAHILGHRLLPLIIDKMLLLSLTHGTSPLMAFASMWYAHILCNHRHEIEKGYRLGKLSLSMLRKTGSTELGGRVGLLFNLFIRYWKEHIRESALPLLEAPGSFNFTGAGEHAFVSTTLGCMFLFYAGHSLEQIRKRLAELLTTPFYYTVEEYNSYVNIWEQTISNLMGLPSASSRLMGDLLDESLMAQQGALHRVDKLKFPAYCCRTLLHYLFGRYRQALESAEQAEKYRHGEKGHPYLLIQNFYHALTLLALYPEADDALKEEYLGRVASLMEPLRHWARNAPMNAQHKLDLVEAERERVAGDSFRAMVLYGSAIKGARDNGCIQEEALAYEREACFHLDHDREDLAGLCIGKACEAYRIWGAAAKTGELEKRYKYLLAHEKPEPLDTAAIINITQTLSQEIRLEQLLEIMMRTVIENAGAEKGVLIQKRGDSLVIQAWSEIGWDRVETLQEKPLEQSTEVPHSVIYYVARTMTPLILHDACNDSTYGTDGYIAAHHTHSLLCMPVINHGKLTGILYLENNLLTNVFTPTKLELLKTMATQAAISLENARLYTHLVETIRDLRKTEEELHKSEEFLNIVVDNIPDAMFVKDGATLTYIRFNKAAENLLGRPCDDMIGKGDGELFPGDEGTEFGRKDIELLNTGQFLDIPEQSITTVHQGTRILHTKKMPIKDREGKIRYILGVSEDITDRKRDEEKLRASLREKETLIKEIHHRVKNNLQIITSLLSLKANQSKDPHIMDYCSESVNRIRSMALVHESLYRADDLSRTDLGNHIRSISSYLVRNYGKHAINLHIDEEQIFLNVDKAIPCGLLVNELVSNALKHAFPDGREGDITITVRASGDEVTLVVSDNGIGLPEDLDFRRASSMGLNLINDLVDQIDGTIDMCREGGTTFTIRFSMLVPERHISLP